MSEGTASVAVIYASRHGATKEIAEAIQSTLTEHGLSASLLSVDDKIDLAGFGAVILGSAVYMGRWVKDARAFAEENGEQLKAKALWLFSSGPIGETPEPTEEPFGLPELATELGARDHHIFAGKVDKSELGFAERAVLAAVRAEEGDFRDWDDVRKWASEIACDLSAT